MATYVIITLLDYYKRGTERKGERCMKTDRRAAIEKIVTVFITAYGLHYFGYFLRKRYFDWLGSTALDEGISHAIMYLGHLFFLGTFILYALAVKGDRKYFLAVRKRGLSSNLICMIAGAVYGFCAMGICIFAASTHGDIVISVAPQRNVPLFILAFLAVFIQASVEELESRAFAFGKMKSEGVPFLWALVASSVFFAYLHANNPGFGIVPFISIFVVGAQYVLAYHYIGNIWFTCTAHLMWNFTQDFIFGLPDSGKSAVASIYNSQVNGSSFFYDATFGIEGSFMAITVNLLLCVVIALVGRKKKRTDE